MYEKRFSVDLFVESLFFDRFCLILRWIDSIIGEKSGIKYFPGSDMNEADTSKG